MIYSLAPEMLSAPVHAGQLLGLVGSGLIRLRDRCLNQYFLLDDDSFIKALSPTVQPPRGRLSKQSLSAVTNHQQFDWMPALRSRCLNLVILLLADCATRSEIPCTNTSVISPMSCSRRLAPFGVHSVDFNISSHLY